jgi:hypothetical protein
MTPSGVSSEGWAASMPPATAEPRKRQFPVRFIIWGIIAVVVVGAGYVFSAKRGDSGEVTGAGNLDIFDVRAGDCFDLDREGGAPNEVFEVDAVRAIPCAEAHTYEAYFVGEYPSGEITSADEPEYTAWEEEQCLGSFETYVGIDFDSSVLWISAVVPTTESWEAGDHTLICYLYHEGETPVSGSARGSAQ